jgi:hypothetical protein
MDSNGADGRLFTESEVDEDQFGPKTPRSDISASNIEVMEPVPTADFDSFEEFQLIKYL